MAQTKFEKQIEKIITNNRLSHAYLIETNGCDEYKDEIKLFVKKIVLSQIDNEEDIKNISNQIDNNNFINLKIIESSTFIKKEELLGLKRDYSKKAFINLPLIYVIDDAAKLTVATANSILKFLEEPGDNIIAILVTANRYDVIDTIRSRVQILELENDNKTVIDDALKEFITNLETSNNIVNIDKIIEFIPDKIVATKVLKQTEEYYYNLIKENYDEKYIKYVLIIEEAIAKLEYNVNYKLWLDSLLVRFMEVVK